MRQSGVLPFIVAAAVAMIAISNFTVLKLLAEQTRSGFHVFYSVWPLLLTSTVAILLVMSTLYQALTAVLGELKKREYRARQAGYCDPLTQLGNRQLLTDRLQQALSDLRRNDHGFALLMLDLDRFKAANDIYGHALGDEVLCEVASRLRQVVRETDTLIRFGGDEFIILQTAVENREAVDGLTSRVTDALERPFMIATHELYLGASIGVILAATTIDDPTEYVRRADVALYEAKRRGRSCTVFYSPDLDSKLQRRAEIERELADAIMQNAVEIYFQPQISTDANVLAAEALLRWNSKKFGAIPPGEMISIAEEAGLIRSLGELVFRRACRAARQWPGLVVAVNFSPSQLRTENLPEKLAAICRAERVPCEQIELELTESLFLDYDRGCEALIERLRQLGFRIALDDFGAGYSSLRYLRRFHIDKVKLDKGFSDGPEAHQNIAIIRAAVMLAHALNLTVVAEGIETEEQEQMALQGGCDGFQGYLYAPPMDAHDFSKFLTARLATAVA